jgi:hypothetical protein
VSKDYRLTDAERTALLQAALNEATLARPPGVKAPEDLLSAIRKITGTDTLLIARRAYAPEALFDG